MTEQGVGGPNPTDELENLHRHIGKLLRATISGSFFFFLAGSNLFLHVHIWPAELPDLRQSSSSIDLYALLWAMGYDFLVLLLAILGYSVDKTRRRWFFWAICVSGSFMPLIGLSALKAYFR